MTKPIIWVEGIIGSGKSTLTATLAKEMNLRPIYEPVDSNPYLEPFYKDPKKYAFPMQLHLMIERYGLQKLAVAESLSGEKYDGAALDRGLPGDRVFAALHVRSGNISELEWQTYERFYNVMAADLRPPSLIVFLDVDPRVAFERMQKRGRAGESGVPLDYLQSLARGYYDLLSEIESGRHAWSRGMQVLKWPWNVDNLETSPLISEIRHRLHLT